MAESIYKIPKLRGSSNYDIWALRIESILTKEGCSAIMQIEPSSLNLEKYSEAQLITLKEMEAKALSVIRLSLEDGPLLQTKEVTSPYKLWDKLKELYQAKGFSSEFLISKQLINTTLSSCKGNIELYLQTVKRLTNSLEARNLALPDKFIAALVLNNLNKDYDYLVTIITQDLRSKATIDLDQIFSQILDESRRLKGIKSYPHPATTDSDSGSKDIEMSLNSATTKGKHRPNGKSSSICNYCKKRGHNEAKCWTKDPSLKKIGQTKEESLNTSTVVQSCSAIETVNNTVADQDVISWVLDSGASTHVCCRDDVFNFINPVSQTFIKWGNTDTLLEAKGVGDISLTFTSTNKAVKLENVLYVPELGVNLLSLFQSLGKGAHFSFTQKEGLIFKGNSILAKGTYTRKIATFNTISSKARNSKASVKEASISTVNNSVILAHKRLGHIGKQALAKLQSSTEGLDLSPQAVQSNKDLENCAVCIQSKFTKKASKAPPTTEVRNFGDLVYTDLGGPIKPKTPNGFRYYITFLDYKTKYLEVYLLKSRATLVNAIKAFYTRVETQDCVKLKMLQADNELNTEDIQVFATEKGMVLRFTAPHTPEPKGGGERINRTLFDKIRALLIEAGLPRKFWGEALLSSVYLYNRTPNSSLNFVTPYMAKYNKKPDISNIRIWGSLCYKKEPKEFLNKLDSRATPYYLVGYLSNHLYKLLDPKTSRIATARDVQILEGYCYKDKDMTSSREDLVVEEETSSQEEKENRLIIRRNPMVVINNKKPVSTAATVDNTIVAQDPSTLLNSLIEEVVLYTSKDINTPKNYGEVLKHAQREEYLKAMQREFNQLIENNTWKLVPRPSNSPVLKGRWVLNTKHSTTSKDTIFKARWVAKGFLQEYGINYRETFANTSKPNIIRLLLATFSAIGWEIHTWDIKQAFPNAEIDSTIYIDQPEGFVDPKHPDHVCLLNKALYGLKQAGRQWQKLLANLLSKLGFTALFADTATYLNREKAMIIATHVDDLLVFAKTKQLVDQLLKDLGAVSSLEIKNLGEVKEFLGVEVIRKKEYNTLYLTQSSFLERLLQRFNKQNLRPRSTPLPPGIRLESNQEKAGVVDTNYYQQQIGSLIYATIFTRPDLAYAVNSLARYMSNPSVDHFKALDHCWGYVKNTKDLALKYALNPTSTYHSALDPKSLKLNLVGSTDADWGGDYTSRKSTTGYIFLLNHNKHNSAISWLSKLQRTVALSSAEAEFMAYKEATKECLYLNSFIKEIQDTFDLFNKTNQINTDSQSAIELTKNPNYHARTKHVDIRYYFVRERVENQEVVFNYESSTTLLADNLTKATSSQKLKDYNQDINLVLLDDN